MMIDNNHASIRYSKSIQLFCSELFNKTPLNFFIYSRFYRDGSVINLTNHPEWHKYYREKNYHLNIKNRLIFGIHLWRSNKKVSKQILEAQKLFDIYNKIEILENHEEYIESFGYGGGTEDGELDNFYLNNISLLKTYNKVFLSKAFDIINFIQSNNEYLQVNLTQFSYKEEKEISFSLPSKNAKAKLRFTDMKSDSKNIIFLTPKQFEILSLKMRGYSDAFIAKCLNCSCHNIKYHNKAITKKINIGNHETIYSKCEDIGIMEVSKDYRSLIKHNCI